MMHTPTFVRSALLGMGVATLLMGVMFPSLAYALLISLLISGMIVTVGYHVVRRLFEP